MKQFYQLKLLFVFIFIFININVYASKDTVAVAYSYNPEKGLMIKLIPSSPQVFFAGFKNGYNIYRAEAIKTTDGGEKLTEYVKVNSELLKFWPKEKLKAEIEKDSNLMAAALFIGGADEIINRPVQNNPKQSIEQSKADEFLNLLGNFTVIVNNHVAEAMGVFYIDKTIDPSKKYVYKIEIPEHKQLTSYKIIFPLKSFEKEKVLGFTGNLEKGAALLKWYNNGNKTFPYYNIYRSTNKDKGYVKLNIMPYIGRVGNGVRNNIVTSYVDSFPQFDKTYFYKVVGVNAFEEEGINSEPIEIKAFYLLQNFPVITNSTAPDNKSITITWNMDKKDVPFVKGYKVKYATKGDGPYTNLNNELITNTSYTDSRSKGSSNYYIVCAFGASGDSTCSFLKSHLLVDTIPPLAPIMAYGVCDTNGIVTIKWKKNQEPDMLGYRVFKTYYEKTEPNRITKGSVADTVFRDTININQPYNKIFYRAAALDNHFNPSPPSAYIEVKIPDKIPPINGYFKKYSVGMNGVNLQWNKSNAYDLKRMYLLRKGKMDTHFHPILVLSGDSLNMNTYTDTSTKSNEKYAYVLQSEDESGLKSSYTTPIVAEQINKEKVKYVTNLQTFVSKENKMIKLTWDFPYRAIGFKIYRAKNNENITTYEFVAGDKREFYDKWLTPNTSYKYLIVAELEGGFTSGFSKEISVEY